jgi:hypothetical protein
LHLSIFYEYQQIFQHRICLSIQPPALDNTLLLNNIIKKKLVKRANVGHGSL